LLQVMLENPSSDSLILVSGEAPVNFPRTHIRRLMLELALKRRQVPVSLFLKDVTSSEKESRTSGGFADIYYGLYSEKPVALKCLRIYLMCPESQKTRLEKSFYRESILWRNLHHRHVLPFFGITGDVFPHTLCMVLPWMEKGSIRHYMNTLKAQGALQDRRFTDKVDKWLYEIALGLSYLHGEEIVHGDLRGANVLVDENDHVRLADFGLAVITHCANTTYENSLVHGGSIRWQAPELLDPERFGVHDRPTFESDIYSFGITCVELYTNQAPFVGFQDQQIYVRVLRGDRPPRPNPDDGIEMPGPLWTLTMQCWSAGPASRPSADDVLHSLLRLNGMGGSPSFQSGMLSPALDDSQIDYSQVLDGVPQTLRLRGVQRIHDIPISGSDTADVYLGRYEGRKVALKRFRIFMRTEHERRLHRTFYREAAKWKDLQHKNVLPFLGIDLTDHARTWCVVTPWMTHGNIRNFITTLKDSHLFDIDSLRLNKWLTQIAKGLAYLHAHHIVHGNLWGRNVMINSNWDICLADYGQAFMQSAETGSISSPGAPTASGYSTGTDDVETAGAHRWMAPELLSPETSDQNPTNASDVYSFGCVCIELYTCQNPFKDIRSDVEFLSKMLDKMDRPHPPRPDISRGAIAEMPDDLWDLLEQCWSDRPAERLTSHTIAQMLTKSIDHPRSYRDD